MSNEIVAGKFTPGPWEIHEVGDGIKFFAPSDASRTSLLTVVEERGYGMFAAVYNEADARLIAEAPDLLQALKGFVSLMRTPASPVRAKALTAQAEVARALIAKALGEQA